MTRGIGVMNSPKPQTFHDFGGFPRGLDQPSYDTPGDQALVWDVLDLLLDGVSRHLFIPSTSVMR